MRSPSPPRPRRIAIPRNYRHPDGPAPTLGALQLGPHAKWVWLSCNNLHCSHRVAVPLAPFVIRWGADASSDRLRINTVCRVCGHRGASLQVPGITGPVDAREPDPFPAEQGYVAYSVAAERTAQI